MLVPLLHMLRLHLLVIKKCRRHEVLALAVKFGDPADVGAEILQRIKLRLDIWLVLAAHHVLIGSVLHINLNYRSKIIVANISARDI